MTDEDTKRNLELEELKQLHEDLRAFEQGLFNAFTLAVLAYTTLLWRISGFLFRTDPVKLS